jgi:hypothetical protein
VPAGGEQALETAASYGPAPGFEATPGLVPTGTLWMTHPLDPRGVPSRIPIEFLEWGFPRRTSHLAWIDTLVGSGFESRAGFQGS